MFDILTVFAILLAIKEIVEEKAEKPAPKGTRFDWGAYWKDVENGVTTMEQVKKSECGGYNTTMPILDVVDVERYEHDKKVYGEDTAEGWKQRGYYKFKRKFMV